MRVCWKGALEPEHVAADAKPKEWPRWYKWLQIRYVPRNDWYSRPQPLPYEQGFTWDWSDYWVWEHPRVPRMYHYHYYTAPKADMAWTINQVCFDAERGAKPGALQVQMGTVTPNFDTFLARVDHGDFQAVDAAYLWKLHRGANQLALRVRNRSGVLGPVSRLEVAWRGTDESAADQLSH